MPIMISGDTRYKAKGLQANVKFDYEYPLGLDLSPGSKLHDRIRDEVMTKAFDSARVMSTRHAAWNSIDHTLTAYIPVDEQERLVKDKDSRKPTSIVFPYSYTVLETLLSFYVAAFLTDPIFRYEGNGPKDVIGAILLEKVIALQCVKNKVGLNLHTQARDAFAYGFGVATPTWVTEYGKKTVKQKSGGLFGFGGSTQTIVLEDQLLFEGNALENIDPYLYLPDTSVPIHAPQTGEFVGWVSPTNYMTLLSNEANSGEIFNVKYLKSVQGRRSCIFPSDNSGRNTKSGMTSGFDQGNTSSNPVDVVKMFIRLIPKEWELSDREVPELWYFEVGSDEIVINAKAANLDHNKFPVSVIAPDFDGYSISPVSRIEMLYGMQGVLDFMFNSHVAAVRRTINDRIIYDPYLVNSADLKNPDATLIRLRRPAWGKGVKEVAQQLLINDVTRANVSDSTWIVQWMDRISGADSSMQGALRTGGPERLTGAEFQGTRAGGINRLDRIAKVVGLQGIQDIGNFFGLHNKQMMTNQSFIKLSGDWQEVLMAEYDQQIDRGRISVDPSDLDINYQVTTKEGGALPSGDSQTWIQLYQILGQNPELAQKFDVVRIFQHIARLAGAKNVNDFIRRGGGVNTQQMPDETVRAQAQAGNIIPINQAMGGGV